LERNAVKSGDETAAQDRIGQVQSLVKAFAILDELAAHGEGLTLTQIALNTKLPRSTVHRLLTTMSTRRHIEFECASNRWMLGLNAMVLGTTFVATRDLARLGRPIMRSLMIDAGETVNIAVAGDDGGCYAGQMRPANALYPARTPGAPLPMHTTASGKVLLANWGAPRRDAFLSSRQLYLRTPQSIIEKNALASQLDLIRMRGYAVDDQENAPGVRCVAAPVFDWKGDVRASISISGPVERISDARITALGEKLTRAAKRMTEDVGGLLTA
jgi:IclR family transcriptional regulator, acetate operon repressor